MRRPWSFLLFSGLRSGLPFGLQKGSLDCLRHLMVHPGPPGATGG